MKANIKTQFQEKAFEVLKDKTKVILKWATGCGKSKMVIDLLNYATANVPSGKKLNTLFVVAEKAHMENWRQEFIKWKLCTNKTKVNIICYASLHKMRDNSYDIIVFDEAHHMFTDKRKALIETIGAERVYLLSATLSTQKIQEAEEIFGKFSISTVTLKEAINTDILPDPRVYIVEMGLDNTVPNQEIQVGSGDNLPVVSWENRNKYITRKISCIIKCTQYQKYIYLTTTMDYWKQRYERSHNEFHRNKWVSTGSVRKRYLGELKTEFVSNFIHGLSKKKRFVCFCSSVAQANELSKSNTISSKKPSSKNQKIIDTFNEKGINSIYAVGMITEGMNLTDIELGIIVQLDGKERLFVQKFGRSLRAEDPVSVIFYFKNTQDEVYLKNAMENIDSKYVQYININQLNAIKV